MGSSNEQGSGGNFLLGLLLGGAIGAIAALLYAPQRGDETRDLLAQKSNEYATVAKQKTSEVADQVEQTAGEYTEKASAVVDSVKAKSAEVAANVTDKAQDVAGTVKDTATDLADKGKKLYDAKTQQVADAVDAVKDGFNDKKQELQASIAGDDSEAAA